jgi:hypothetical protein
MPPVFGALVAVENALVILAGGEGEDVLAVDHDDEAGFLAVEEVLDDDAGAGIAELVAREHVVDGGVGFFQRHRDNDALAGGQAVGLDDDGRALLVDVGVCCGRLGKSLKTGRRDVVASHEALGEILGGFKLGGFLGRAEDLQTTGAENIDHASRQRRFRADDGEVDLVLLGEISQGFRIGDVDVFQLVLARRAGVAGGDVNFLHTFGLRQTPGHGVFAAAGTDYQ